SAGTGTKTGLTSSLAPLVATVVVVVSMKQWTERLSEPLDGSGGEERVVARRQGKGHHLRALVVVDYLRSRRLIGDERHRGPGYFLAISRKRRSCPCAASGHTAAAPPRSTMNSRHFIRSPRRRGRVASAVR